MMLVPLEVRPIAIRPLEKYIFLMNIMLPQAQEFASERPITNLLALQHAPYSKYPDRRVGHRQGNYQAVPADPLYCHSY